MKITYVKKAVIYFCFSVIFFSCRNSNKPAENKEKTIATESYYTPNPSGFIIKKGVNISHWLSQCFGWSPRDRFITKQDIALIDSLGYDHVRLPIDEEELWFNNRMFNDTSLFYLHSCIDWCLEKNLRVIVDLHILKSHHFNSRNGEGTMTLWTDTSAQNNFISQWKMLSDELKQYPNSMVAYEPMNEPVAPEHEMWNNLLEKTVKTLREREPERVLIFGSNRWQKPHSYPYLRIPKNDKNIILSFHSYHPYFLTHHKAYWSVAKDYHGSVSYPGQTISDNDYKQFVNPNDSALLTRIEEETALEYFDRNKLVEIFKPVIDKGREMGLQIYCNEFGCLPSPPLHMRLQYYTDIKSIFDEYNIAFANWDFKGDFGIVGWDRMSYENTHIDTAVVNILLR